MITPTIDPYRIPFIPSQNHTKNEIITVIIVEVIERPRLHLQTGGQVGRQTDRNGRIYRGTDGHTSNDNNPSRPKI